MAVLTTIERWVTQRENLERVTIVGPYDEGRDVLRALSAAGYRTLRSGPYTDKKMYPKVDPTRFLFTAERPLSDTGKPKGKPGFHVISLKGSKKLQRLHSELLTAKCKLSSLELTRRTQLVAISTWLNHLKKNGINVQNEQRTENGQQVWYWWIE